MRPAFFYTESALIYCCRKGDKDMINKNWLKTSMAIVMASAMLIAGCGNSDDKKDNNKEASKPEGSEVSTEPVTFTYFGFGTNKDVLASDTTIGKILQQQTGVDWKMEFVVGDASTKSGVMIAGGEYPDVISPVAQLEKLVDAGALVPLNELNSRRCRPNMRAGIWRLHG